MESKETRLVWITILAMKDSEGRVFAAVNALAHRARVTEKECQEALGIFLKPDPRSMSQKEEGRRLREIAGGWEVVNHEEYRFSTEAKREFWKEQKRKQREAEALRNGKPPKKRKGKSAAQVQAENDSRQKRYDEAKTEEEREEIVAEGIPDMPMNYDEPPPEETEQ